MRIFFLFQFLLVSVLVNAGQRFIKTSDSVDLFVRVKGEGPVCLYIHGGPGSGSDWLEQFMGDSLERHFKMVYLDQRGVGRSSTPANHDYSMVRMVKDFEEVRKALGIEKWLIMGHSFGGILQMAYIESNPEFITGMIFINCSVSLNNSFESSWLPKAIELAGNDVPPVCMDTGVSVYSRMLAIMPVLGKKDKMWEIFYGNRDDNQKMNDTYRKFENWNGDQSERILEYHEYWQDFREFTGKVMVPVLFFYGKKDWAIGPGHYKIVRFPEMLLWGSDVGHVPFLENKADIMNAINIYLGKYGFAGSE